MTFLPFGRPHERLITLVHDRPGHDRRYAIDPAKVETADWMATRETLESGLKKTVAWYLTNRDWWEPLRNGVYRGERLGLITPAEARCIRSSQTLAGIKIETTRLLRGLSGPTITMENRRALREILWCRLVL